MKKETEENLFNALNKADEIIKEAKYKEEVALFKNNPDYQTKEQLLKLFSMGYSPTYDDFLKLEKQMDTEFLRVFCENGLDREVATRILEVFAGYKMFSTEMPIGEKLEWMDILVKIGLADIRVISIESIKRWYDREKTKVFTDIEVPVYGPNIVLEGANFGREVIGHTTRRVYFANGALAVFEKMIELGYTPTTYEEVINAFLPLAEKLAGENVLEKARNSAKPDLIHIIGPKERGGM